MTHARASIATWYGGALLLALAGPARAQGPAGRLLTTADGLADNTVQCIAQDRQGFLWVGTQDGLSRYDGSAFRTFRADARQPGALAGNFVRALAPDAARGGLWVGTGSGVCYYEPRTERFARVPADSSASYFVNALLPDPAGGVWIGTETGLWRYAPARRQLARYQYVAAGAAASAGRRNSVRALARDGAGTLWAGTGEGRLCRFDAATGTLRPEPRYGPPGPAPLSALAAAPGGGLWAGTEAGGLRYLPPGGPAVEVIRPRPGGPAVRGIWVDARGGAWVATAAGLRCWPAPPGPAAAGPGPLRLAGDVQALGPDRTGQLWAGTSAGLRRLDTRPSPFARLAPAATGPVWAVAAAPGGLWVGTEQQGLLRLDPRTGAVAERLRHRPRDPASLADDYVRCVLPDAAGGLWAGTQHQGLDYRPPGAAGFRHFRHAAAQAASLADDFVRCLYRDPRDGALWVGTEGGLSRLADEKNGRFVTYRHRAGDPRGLPNNFVRCVLRDRAGRLWVGTGGGGLCRLDDPATGRFTAFTANARDARSLPGNFVRALCLDAAGRLWVGTEDGGLARLDDARTGRFTAFGEAQGLPNGVVYAVVPDSAALALWVSTNRGLARLDLATDRLTAFDARDGLPQDEYNAGAAGQGPGGRFYFGGPGGLVGFRAAALPPPPAPPVLLTGLRRMNQAVTLPDTAVGQRRLLRLGPRDYVLTLDFAALDLRRASRYRLFYQLEGFDPDWVAAGPRREATYTNLGPGQYTFRVRGAGAPPGAGAALRLVVAPPWYGTWWFRALAAGAAAGAAWLAYRQRVGQLLALERVRHRIARDLHDDMGSTLSSINLLSELARQHQLGQRPAQAAGLLTQIQDASRQMLDAMDDIVWAINPAHDGMADVTARMRAFAAELLEARGMALAFDVDPAVGALRLPMERRREFFLVFKEAVNNVAKYAGGQHARVALTYAPGQLSLLVADDGVGFDPAAPARGGGHGLANMRARAAALRGELTLTSAPGRGTAVRLRLPL
ncbi:two-component regulator propeller domain-containing protein [Hymenobacter caeli]|uniref:Oxygen sensor histidine kinase NreB n=1 Tax=Hymenobacter caeli TaxID=2735894 RepID=A0ABX2FML1_9BACT|nr:sensor histidine kinase [Hymenobacter caeli]NRT18390.1 ligand-binding sensor domain-containing protein/signal transduction histidine kinase [Hymenobacter caeli]